MKNVLELFYDQPTDYIHGPDSLFVRTARIKNESMELLSDSLTDEQKEMLEDYIDANSKIEDMIHFDSFRYAFHLGAQLMVELTEGREELLK